MNAAKFSVEKAPMSLPVMPTLPEPPSSIVPPVVPSVTQRVSSLPELSPVKIALLPNVVKLEGIRPSGLAPVMGEGLFPPGLGPPTSVVSLPSSAPPVSHSPLVSASFSLSDPAKII